MKAPKDRKQRTWGVMMYHIGICDDDKNICEELDDMLRGIMEELHMAFVLETWCSCEDLCAYLDAGNSCDLLFLDIEFPGRNGVDAGGYIRDRLDDRKTSIVYISCHTGYAMQLFQFQPIDFLIKPLAYDAVKRAVCVFMKSMERRRYFLEFQIGNAYYRQPCDEILYLYSDDKKVCIVTSQGEKEFYGKLKDVLHKLPPHFIQIHKSFIVNQDCVIQYSYERVKMMNDEILNISRPYKNKVRERMIYDKREREHSRKNES